MKHYGDTSMKNVRSNLPDSCRERLREMEDAGWSCSFYLGVIDNSMAFGVTARKGDLQCIACSTDVETAVENLSRDVSAADEDVGTE